MLTYPIKTKSGKEKKIHIKTGRETIANIHIYTLKDARRSEYKGKMKPKKDTRTQKMKP